MKMKMKSDKWKFMFDRQLILGDSFRKIVSTNRLSVVYFGNILELKK